MNLKLADTDTSLRGSQDQWRKSKQNFENYGITRIPIDAEQCFSTSVLVDTHTKSHLRNIRVEGMR